MPFYIKMLNWVISQPPSALGGWLQSLPLASLLMDALPRPNAEEKRNSLRVISEMTAPEIHIVAKEFAVGLERLLKDSVGALKKSFDAMDNKPKVVNHSASKFSVPMEMKCGSIKDFHHGLQGRIGDHLSDMLH